MVVSSLMLLIAEFRGERLYVVRLLGLCSIFTVCVIAIDLHPLSRSSPPYSPPHVGDSNLGLVWFLDGVALSVAFLSALHLLCAQRCFCWSSGVFSFYSTSPRSYGCRRSIIGIGI